MVDSIQPSQDISRGPQLRNDKNPSLEDSKKMDSVKKDINQYAKKNTSKNLTEEIEPQTTEKRKVEEEIKDDVSVILTKISKHKKEVKESEKFDKFLEPEKGGAQKSNKKPRIEQSLGFEPDKMPLRAQDVSKNKELDINLAEKEKERPKQKESKEQNRFDTKDVSLSKRIEKQKNIFPGIDNNDLSGIASTLNSYSMKNKSYEASTPDDSLQQTVKKLKITEIDVSKAKETSVDFKNNNNLNKNKHISEIQQNNDSNKKTKLNVHRLNIFEEIKNKAEVKAKHNITPSQTPNSKGNSKGSGLSK
ncbi:MAG: hypothetical protein K0R02_628 [Rickettsiaceae bacterium]|jgi:hypothetical protein|nr:hypothetical protein [Rickettsiaceae bacterium]